MPVIITEPIYTLKEVAERCGIGLQSVRNAITNGKLKSVKMNNAQGTRMVHESALLEFMKRDRPGNPNFKNRDAE